MDSMEKDKADVLHSRPQAMGILGGGGNQDESHDQDDGDASIVSQLDPNTGQITFRSTSVDRDRKMNKRAKTNYYDSPQKALHASTLTSKTSRS